jgi:hypothetical protein
MDIHKSKPWHGWREFLKEVGIIVLGVLIALAGEQSVEALHWSHQTRDTELTLRSEIQESADAVAERQVLDTCLRSQLVALRAAAVAGPAGPAFAPPTAPAMSGRVVGDLYQTPWRAWTRGSWEAAVASNSLNHVDPQRLIAYADAYKAIEDIDAIIRQERGGKGALAPLSLGKLGPQEAGQVLSALTNLDRDRADIEVAGHDLLESAAKLGIKPGSADDALAAFRTRTGACA